MRVVRALLDPSLDMRVAKRLVDRVGPARAREIIRRACSRFTNVERAALAARWETWARPKQLPPADWRTWGNLTSRGWGKSMTIAKIITSEIQAGRVRVLIMAAQNLTKTEAVQVEGLIAAAPPWFRPIYHATSQRLDWPNGAKAFAYTPEVPDAIRSENADMAWLSEVQSWPAATREEAYSNFVFATRVRGARLMWDATPKRRHPLLKRFLARAASHPTKHIVVRGSIDENPHISKDALETMQLDYGGTQKGREELLGEMLDDEGDALFQQAWLEKARRVMPDKLKRRIIIIDPAITDSPKYSDATGILDMGLGIDDQLYTLVNMSGVHRAEVWPGMVIDAYVRGGCDLVLVETNRGGTAWAALLRVAVRDRGLTLVELGPTEKPPGAPGVVYMRGINTKRSKAIRAEGAAALCERGRVSFVVGRLGDLEERLCAFDGNERGPDDAVDTFVHGCHELAGLGHDVLDPKVAFRGIAEMSQALNGARAPEQNIAALLGRGSTGRI